MSKVYKLAFSKPSSVFQAISEFDHMPILRISGRKKKENFYFISKEQSGRNGVEERTILNSGLLHEIFSY